MANDPQYYIDPRTGRAFSPRQEPQHRDRQISDRTLRVRAMFGELVKMPVYKELKSLAQSLSASPYPNDINTAISWVAAQARRSGFALLFSNIERVANAAPIEEQEAVAGMRSSYFPDAEDEAFSGL